MDRVHGDHRAERRRAVPDDIGQSMLPAQLEGIAEGAAITVAYDPDNPSEALIYGW